MSSIMLHYRNALRSDLPVIVEIYNQTIASRQVTADLQAVTVESRQAWFEQHTPDKRPLWLILCEQEVCGWISLSSFYGRPAYDKTVEISLYIDQRYRGRKIADWIVPEIEKFAVTLGIENILCYIFGHNTPSLSLFAKHSYQRWGFLPQVAELDGVKRDLVILAKKVS